MTFAYPEAWLLAIPLLAAFRIWRQPGRPLVTVLRGLLALALLALLAEPYQTAGTKGRDLILVADRSRSAPPGSEAQILEIAERAQEKMRPGDRIGVVSFARQSLVELAPSEEFRAGLGRGDALDRDATDLAQALERALGLIPPGRQGSILLVSDGENTGADVNPVARAALRRGVRIDAIPLLRAGAADVAVEELGVPGEIGAGEPFQVSAWIRSDRPQRVTLRVLRDGVPIATGERELRAGLNRYTVADLIGVQGLHSYAVEVDLPDGAADRVPENDRAQAVLRVVGSDRVLCVTPGGREDRLVRALRSGGLEVVVSAPERAPLTRAALDGFRAVVLENVPAGDLPDGSMAALAAYVRDHGGGLLMTGGRASFGVGGYHRSPLEPALPITLEVRQEQRKFALAMAVVLDRSGSMAMRVPSGEAKMDLANLGTIAAIELLGPMDEFAAIAVDSQPHVVVPLTELTDPAAAIDKVRRIESSGGGIFTFTGLRAGAEQLSAAKATNKHIVIFADAADAEEPGEYETFVPKLVLAGVTVSVIGLGSPTDTDAEFLRDLARYGRGPCTFVTDPMDLPRVFAQQTIEVVRSSFVEDGVGADVLPDVLAVGDLGGTDCPGVGGYNVAYLESGASLGMRTDDETDTPLFSFWQHGLGRSAAFLGEVDGEFSGPLATWDGYADFFTTVVRYVAGSRADDRVFADMRRRGHRAVLTVEVPAEATGELGRLEALVVSPTGKSERVFLQRSAVPNRLEASLPLDSQGAYQALIRLGDGSVVKVPPITLPYSPEFEPRTDPEFGRRTLQRIVEVAEGRLDPALDAWFDGPRDSAGVRFLGVWFALLGLALALSEIAVRRLDLRLPKLAIALPRRAPRVQAEPETAPEERAADVGGPEESVTPKSTDIADILSRTKSRRRR